MSFNPYYNSYGSAKVVTVKELLRKKPNFSDRLKTIGLDSSQVPDELQDPITHEIMNVPFRTDQCKIFDYSSLITSNFIDPFSGDQVKGGELDIRTLEKIESFVKEKEELSKKSKKDSKTAAEDAANAVAGTPSVANIVSNPNVNAAAAADKAQPVKAVDSISKNCTIC